ncbi:EamA family transporter [Candidatus Woesearchaeota archaeon]|nr:EamA family transporter [Candidatus Woesearchaeota archaeon]
MTTQLWAIILVLVGSLYGALGPIYWKKGAKYFSLSIKGTLLNNNLMKGGLLWGSSFLPLIYAFKGGEVSVLAPLMSTGYIWVIIFSMFMLKEKINSYKWTGILLIVLGVSLIGLGS